ncbi:MAG TPA: LytTR family transcriptional regulator DNA-binding domain-containing protein [Holophagaceae bacterium]|nr:LytTR family transcriptional regulator DNA-binding domain-containing protein [Holophagaceae bacterium]
MTQRIRTLVVDDEPLARQRLRQLLEQEADVDLVGECTNGREAVAAIREKAPDLVFLDIQMPELGGFGVVEEVGAERMPATLFVTAFDRHAVQAFEVNALDYLLKPFDEERFQKALARFRTLRAHHGDSEASGLQAQLQALLDQLAGGTQYLERVLVKSGDRHRLVKVEDIQWVEAEDNYVRLHVEGTSHLLRQTLAGLSERLDPRRFRRIHRSSLVNLDHVLELQPWFSGDYMVLMHDGTKLTLSRTYKEQFKDLLG